jgi:hypothetical protein
MNHHPRSAVLQPAAFRADAGVRRPNEIDERRILRSLQRRARYRYVSPELQADADGYRILSPCCSRNVDASGGKIDIARLGCDGQTGAWQLYSRNHVAQTWELQGEGLLHELLAFLCADPQRIFWK